MECYSSTAVAAIEVFFLSHDLVPRVELSFCTGAKNVKSWCNNPSRFSPGVDLRACLGRTCGRGILGFGLD